MLCHYSEGLNQKFLIVTSTINYYQKLLCLLNSSYQEIKRNGEDIFKVLTTFSSGGIFAFSLWMKKKCCSLLFLCIFLCSFPLIFSGFLLNKVGIAEDLKDDFFSLSWKTYSQMKILHVSHFLFISGFSQSSTAPNLAFCLQFV